MPVLCATRALRSSSDDDRPKIDDQTDEVVVVVLFAFEVVVALASGHIGLAGGRQAEQHFRR